MRPRTRARNALLSALIPATILAIAAGSVSAPPQGMKVALAANSSPTASPAPSPTASRSAGDLLRQAVEADDHVSYTGTVTTLVYGERGADATVVRIDHAAPNKWRMWYVAPADAYGRLIVSDEKTTYQYEPKIATVFSDAWEKTPALTLDVDAARVLKNYHTDLGAATDIAGRQTIALSFVNKYSGALVQRVWLDAATKLVLQRETYHGDGSIDTRNSFDDIRMRSDLPADLFSLSVPAGMHVEPGTIYGKVAKDIATLQSGLDFSVKSPAYVPQGFAFDRVSLASQGGIDTVQLLYTDGLRDFSVFENSTSRLPQLLSPKSITVDDSTGETDEIAGETLLSWNAGGLNITLVGDLPASLLARIGASVRP